MDSELPNPEEVVALYRLIHECCEIGVDTYAWRERFLLEIERMIDAQMSVSYVFLLSLDPNDIGPKTVVYHERGTNEAWKQYLRAGDLTRDPVTPPIMSRLGTNFTVKRVELVDDATWYASWYYKEVISPSAFGDIIYSQVGVKDPRVIDGESFVRAMGKPPFTSHDVAVVKFAHQELARLWNRPDPIGIHTLPPRQRGVLDGMRRGESRKLIAEKMSVSEHTVHTYEEALFERAGVSGRGELLAALSAVIRPNLLP